MTDELDEDSKFTREIEYNSNICSNCYRRLRHVILPHETLPTVVSNKLEYTDSAYFDYFGDEDNSGRPSIKQSYCECGFVDKDGKVRPLDDREMMEVAVRVRDRLEEKDIEFNEDTFFSGVKERMSDPSMQFNEEKILEEATDEAIVTNSEENVKNEH